MAVDKNMPILIVDDFNTMLRVVKNLLRQLGFNNVDEASDGSQALEMMRGADNNFGLVISDWNRPKTAAAHHDAPPCEPWPRSGPTRGHENSFATAPSKIPMVR